VQHQHGVTGHAGAGLGDGQLQQRLALVGDEGLDIHCALTLALPVAALVMTAPPLEWPTCTIGPLMVSRKAAR
jgi:hypothetical protein